MWELITQGNDFNKILQLLEIEYDKSTVTIEPFLTTFISGLEIEGYLKRRTDYPEVRMISEEKTNELGGEESRWRGQPN